MKFRSLRVSSTTKALIQPRSFPGRTLLLLLLLQFFVKVFGSQALPCLLSLGDLSCSLASTSLTVGSQSDAPPAFESARYHPQQDPSTVTTVANHEQSNSSDNRKSAVFKHIDDGEPPPPYTESSSPLDSFTYVMAAVGGGASILTQVSQGGGGPISVLGSTSRTRTVLCCSPRADNSLGGSPDDNITLELRYVFSGYLPACSD